MNFLFWNIAKKNLVIEIAEIIVECKIAVVILAECDIETDLILVELRKINMNFHEFSVKFALCNKIRVFTSIHTTDLRLIHESKRTVGIGIKGINLIISHYISKLHHTDSDQNAEIPVLKEFIDFVEEKEKHKRTVVCGDFNMNPFQDAMVQTSGLHAVMERNIAKNIKKTFQDRDYFYFYNPMWSFYGDLGKGKVSGTYYYKATKPINYHWNIFDQVIIRPELIDTFDNEYLDIISTIKTSSLLKTNGQINDKKYSDHLPIKFSLNI
jgi:exonuclease III